MKCSAWSLRAISACSALVFAAPAWAHLSVSPTRATTGAAVDLTFAAPNEDDALGIDHVMLRAPATFDVDDAEAKPGWTQSRAGDAITWSGGNIPKGQFATFAIRGTAPAKAGTVLFGVLVGDRSGRSVTYRVALAVSSPSQRLDTPALVVALVAAALALAAFFLGLYQWLRPSR